MTQKQLLHMVIGGELKNPNEAIFEDLENIEVVGFYPNYKLAEKAWRGAAQATVDNAKTRYFVVHLHKLLDPSE